MHETGWVLFCEENALWKTAENVSDFLAGIRMEELFAEVGAGDEWAYHEAVRAVSRFRGVPVDDILKWLDEQADICAFVKNLFE